MEPSFIKSVGSSVSDELGLGLLALSVRPLAVVDRWFQRSAGCRPLQQTLSVQRAAWREAESRRFLRLLLPDLLG